MHRLKSTVRFQKAVLLLAVVYQLFRGTILTITILIAPDRSVLSFPGGMVVLLTIVVSSCIPALILLQLYLTDAQVLLAPARIAKLLEATALIFAAITTVRGALPVAETRQILGILAILSLADVILFAYLIVYRRRAADHVETSLPVASIEEVEEH